MTSVDWTYENDIAVFQGELSIFTIDVAFEKKTLHAFHNKNVVIDLAGINKIDTAGLAWLLCLVEAANKTKSEISFHNIPQDLIKLAKLSAVDLFLPTNI
ncbi:STAS domain-containing protein [Pseudocolwellia sp. HL-MZ19]|uniref:STAS domain-containing protein n=1 Tax=unclassified Pseudocolwellia TaxID=2848178 RepID=UPI003CF50956